MDSDSDDHCDILLDDDSISDHEHVEDDDNDDDEFLDMEAEPSSAHEKADEDRFPFEVLTATQIVQHMVDSIREVNAVVQVKIT